MAFGQNYYDDKYKPTVNGITLINDSNDAIDRTALDFSMWAGTIKISISPRIKDEANDRMITNREAGGSIWLTPSKAEIFAKVIEQFYGFEQQEESKKKENPFSGWSVFTKQGIIGIYSGKSVGANTPCIIIKKVNANSGAVETEYAYQLKYEGYEVIKNFDEKSGNFDRDENFSKYLEFELIINQLRDYGRYANKAAAFHTFDGMAYNLNTFHENMIRIGQSMGLQMSGVKGNSNNTNSKSFFDRNNSKEPSYNSATAAKKTTTIDDILNS